MKILQEMGCGGCGCFDFNIFQNEDFELVAKCVKCHSQTLITVKAELDYETWEGEGGLCPMERMFDDDKADDVEKLAEVAEGIVSSSFPDLKVCDIVTVTPMPDEKEKS